MSNHDPRELLVEALDFFNDHPRFSLRRDRRRNSYELASRIDAFLARGAMASSDPTVACATSQSMPAFRGDPGEQIVRRDGDAYWVRAWVRVDAASLGQSGTGLADRYGEAIAALPQMTRQAFLSHQRDDEDYRTIAARLGITTGEVEQHVADALIAIGQALDRR